jgi:hypothetical protein
MRRALALAGVSFGLLAVTAAGANAGHVRYAGHVQFPHTSCCGFQEVVLKVFGRSNVPYRVCVAKPDGSQRCKAGVTRGSGVPSKKTFGSESVGTFRVAWKVGGRVVDTSSWTNVAEGV